MQGWIVVKMLFCYALYQGEELNEEKDKDGNKQQKADEEDEE